MARKHAPRSHPAMHHMTSGPIKSAHLSSAVDDAWQDLLKRAQYKNRTAVSNGLQARSHYQIQAGELQSASDKFIARAYPYLYNAALMSLMITIPINYDQNIASHGAYTETITNNIYNTIRKYLNIAIYSYKTDPNNYLSIRSVALINTNDFIECIEEIIKYNIHLKELHSHHSGEIVQVDFRPNHRAELIELSDWANFCTRFRRSSLISDVTDAVESKAIAKRICGVDFRKIIEPIRPKKSRA